MPIKTDSEKLNISPMSNVRWTIVALLFFATTINYIDRQVIGLLKPFIQDDLHWDEADYGNIVAAFQIAYALGMLISGRLLDTFGTRIGYSLSILVWSIGASIHALMRSVFGFGAARAILGLGEAGNFPAAVKTIAEWFPKKRPGIRHRHFQFRLYHRSHHRAHPSGGHHAENRLEMGVRSNWSLRIHLADILDVALS